MLSIVVPTLNEAENLARLIPEIRAAMKKRSYEIVIVDDNSKDGTSQVIKKLKAAKHPINFICRKTERGLSTAVIAGFKAAKGDIVGVMDADLSHPPSLLPVMYDSACNGVDIVVASRYIKGGGCEQWPLMRRIYSLGATFLARLLTRVKDPMSGYFMFNKRILRIDRLKPIGYKILLEILVKCPYHSFAETPYMFRNRFVGKSKLNNSVMSQYVQHLIRLYAYKIHARFAGNRREL